MNVRLFTAVGMAIVMILGGRANADGPLAQFVVRRGDQLFEGDKPFRFISVNIPNLQVVEDDFNPSAASPWAWPAEFELTDALEAVRHMGGAVARTYVLGVRRQNSDMGDFVYVRGPGQFNEEAFRTLDLAIEIAGQKGVRLIIPLVDNWQWHGGRAEYAAFRGKQAKDFWSDEQLIADFEATVRHVLTRVNSRTGVPYRDDPAILGWETGNELDCPPSWTARIAALMKQLDPNHLVIDGNSLHGVPLTSLDDPHVDVITTHHYPDRGVSHFVPPILQARAQTRGKKPYVVGEFGFAAADEIERVYDAVIDQGISGALIWSLRYRRQMGGFYWHSEPAGGRLYKAYHWPGFASGEAYQERRVMQLTRTKAFAIRGLAEPVPAPAAAPILLAIDDPAAISWQGSVGAEDYVVERSLTASGPWRVVARGVDEAALQYRPLFSDETATPEKSYYYRIIARNGAGASPPSNVVGPVVAAYYALVDECRDLARLAAHSGNVQFVSEDARQRREDAGRLALPAGGSVTYKLPEQIRQWAATVYRPDDSLKIEAEASADGESFQPIAYRQSSSETTSGDYGYLQQLALRSLEIPAGSQFLRLKVVGRDSQPARGAVELSWIKILYLE
ncbi:MAG: hypothetical protein IT424_05165 [Pirellulales bacterium]|nr:hypothetical protein [Pirellulales bacterium]